MNLALFFKDAPLTVTSSNNEKLPPTRGDGTVSDTIQMVPGRLYGHNRLTNPSMGIDQRVGPYVLNGTPNAPAGAYTLDQWYVEAQCSVAVSQVAVGVGNSYYLSIQRTGGAGSIKVGQTISRNDARGTYTQILSAQLRCFVGANFSSLGGVTLTVYAGTGVNDINNVKTSTPFSGQAVVISRTFTPSTVNSLITAVSNSLSPALTTQLSFELSWTPLSATPGANDIFYFSQCQLETSPNPTPFQRLSYSEQLQHCLYYYKKSYAYKVDPGTPKAQAGLILYPSAYQSGLLAQGILNGWYVGSVEFEPMYSTPSVTIYSYNGNKGRLSQAGTGNDLNPGSGIATSISEKGFAIINASGGQLFASNGGFWHHFVLEAVI